MWWQRAQKALAPSYARMVDASGVLRDGGVGIWKAWSRRTLRDATFVTVITSCLHPHIDDTALQHLLIAGLSPCAWQWKEQLFSFWKALCTVDDATKQDPNGFGSAYDAISLFRMIEGLGCAFFFCSFLHRTRVCFNAKRSTF